jgi:hypothetical protein
LKKCIYKIVSIGDLQSCRIYDETEISPIQAFYSELEIYFKQSIYDGYNIYVVNNKPTHNIIFTSEDIDYISSNPYDHKEEPCDYYFSENLKYIKEQQYEDYK